MATAQIAFTRLEDAPAIREAQGQRAPVAQKLAEVRVKLARVSSVLNPIDAATSTPGERLRAGAAVAELGREVALLEADDEEHARAEAAAREVAFDKMRAQFELADLADCEELVEILAKAARVEQRRLDRIEQFTAAAGGRQPSCDVGGIWWLHGGMWAQQWSAWVAARRAALR